MDEESINSTVQKCNAYILRVQTQHTCTEFHYSAFQHKCPKLYTDNDTQFLLENCIRRFHLGYICTKIDLVSFD